MHLSGSSPEEEPSNPEKSSEITHFSPAARSSYLNEFISRGNHTAEASLALQKYMQQLAADREPGFRPSSMLLDAVGTDKMARKFLECYWPDILLAEYSTGKQDQESYGDLLLAEPPTQKEEMARLFPDISCFVLAAGILADGRSVMFLTFHHSTPERNSLFLPCDGRRGLDFKRACITSDIGLVGMLVTFDLSKNGESLVEQTHYISQHTAEIELSNLANGEISPFIHDLISSDLEWHPEPMDIRRILRAQVSEEGSVEVHILMSVAMAAGNEEQLTLSTKDIGVLRMVFGYSEYDIFGVLDSAFFPDDIEEALFRADLAEDPERIGEEESSNDTVIKASVMPENEKLKSGEFFPEIPNNFYSMNCLEAIEIELKNHGYLALFTQEKLENSRYALAVAKCCSQFLLEVFERGLDKPEIVRAIFEKPSQDESSYEYIVAISSLLVSNEEDQMPMPDYILVSCRIYDIEKIDDSDQDAKISLDIIGIQANSDGLADMLRCLRNPSAEEFFLSFFLTDELPEDFRESKKEASADAPPLEYYLGINYSQNPNSDIFKLPITILDPDTDRMFHRTVCWDSNSGIIPLSSFFGWTGIIDAGEISKENSEIWDEESSLR